MEHITRQLGLSGTLLGRRRKNVFLNEESLSFVLKVKRVNTRSRAEPQSSSSLIFSHGWSGKDCESCSNLSFDDGATESSMSTYEDESSISSSAINGVTFADTLVSAVYERPRTSPTERREMFYSASDYRLFRMDFYSGKPPKDLAVKFCVTPTIHEYESPANHDELYYSENDLQKFLDDFLKSLHV